MKIRVHVYISGRVQGVAFRYNTRSRARSIGVNGWVRNLPDGRVECEFEGPEESVDAMLNFCREGPRLADVRDLEVERMEYSGEYSGFEVRY